MKVSIRKFSVEDTSALLDLFYDTVHTVNAGDYAAEQINAWAPEKPDARKWKERFKSAKTYIAVLDGKIVGFATLEKNVVSMLYVHKDHQRQGVGKSLLEKLEKKIKKKEGDKIEVEASITARAFFEAKGYHIVQENRKMLSGSEFLNFIMEKELNLNDSPMKEKLKDKKQSLWRDLLLSKFFDLLIVITGVTIAFQLNNLKINADQQSLERFYLESMATDLGKDIDACERNIREMKSDLKLVRNYLAKPALSADSLGVVVTETVWFETFSGNQDTYSTLLASNGFTTLSDRDIRNQVTEYYRRYQSIARFEQVYTDLIFQLYTYFSPFCDFSTRLIIDESVVNNVRTRNMLLMAQALLADGLEDYEEMAGNARALKARIEASIK